MRNQLAWEEEVKWREHWASKAATVTTTVPQEWYFNVLTKFMDVEMNV